MRLALALGALLAATPASSQPDQAALFRTAALITPTEAARLRGQKLEKVGQRYRILDIAGLGALKVGVVERRGRSLLLVTDEGRYRLAGPLATPRIAGPGYRVWVVGLVHRGSLRALRLGVLSPPLAPVGPPGPGSSKPE